MPPVGIKYPRVRLVRIVAPRIFSRITSGGATKPGLEGRVRVRQLTQVTRAEALRMTYVAVVGVPFLTRGIWVCDHCDRGCQPPGVVVMSPRRS